jgi:hypothetical protein
MFPASKGAYPWRGQKWVGLEQTRAGPRDRLGLPLAQERSPLFLRCQKCPARPLSRPQQGPGASLHASRVFSTSTLSTGADCAPVETIAARVGRVWDRPIRLTGRGVQKRSLTLRLVGGATILGPDHGNTSVIVKRPAPVSRRCSGQNHSPSPSFAGAHHTVLPSSLLRSVRLRISNSVLRPDPTGGKGIAPQRQHRIFIAELPLSRITRGNASSHSTRSRLQTRRGCRPQDRQARHT